MQQKKHQKSQNDESKTVIIVTEYHSGTTSLKEKLLNLMQKDIQNEFKKLDNNYSNTSI